MSTFKATERPYWAIDTTTDEDFVIHTGPEHAHEGMTAQIEDAIPHGGESRPDVSVKFFNLGTKEHFYVPVSRLDDLIALLSEVRGTLTGAGS